MTLLSRWWAHRRAQRLADQVQLTMIGIGQEATVAHVLHQREQAYREWNWRRAVNEQIDAALRGER